MQSLRHIKETRLQIEEEALKVRELFISEFSDVFAEELDPSSFIKVPPMDLELKPNAVFPAGMRAPPRRYSKHQAEEVHRQLAILLKADIPAGSRAL